MVVVGDCHIGVARRNKWYYQHSISAWKEVMGSFLDPITDGVIIAGDLWDKDSPTPNDLIAVIDTLKQFTERNIPVYVIPGNHDRVTIDGRCAAEVLADINVTVITEPMVLKYGSIFLHFIPYSTDLENVIESHEVDSESTNILISHLTTKEMLIYAGTMSESNKCFNNYSEVILGDYHAQYDNDKFHSIGATTFCNVDEAYSKNCHISYMTIDKSGKVSRTSLNQYDPVKIKDLTEAVDNNTFYIMESNDPVNAPQNVFVKYKSNTEDDEVLEKIEESVNIGNGVDKDLVFSLVFPDMNPDDLKRLKEFESGAIELDELLNGKHKWTDVVSDMEAYANASNPDMDIDF